MTLPKRLATVGVNVKRWRDVSRQAFMGGSVSARRETNVPLRNV